MHVFVCCIYVLTLSLFDLFWCWLRSISWRYQEAAPVHGSEEWVSFDREMPHHWAHLRARTHTRTHTHTHTHTLTLPIRWFWTALHCPLALLACDQDFFPLSARISFTDIPTAHGINFFLSSDAFYIEVDLEENGHVTRVKLGHHDIQQQVRERERLCEREIVCESDPTQSVTNSLP